MNLLQILDILYPPFLLSLVLLGIHSYFGLEIIRRGIIFTDLAIGQMAAFGTAVALLLFGHENYLVSLAFALIGGMLISLASRRVKHLEAFIGLVYAFGVSAVFILLSNSAHGMEKFHDLMAADILFTQKSKIYFTGLLYAALGIFIILVMRKTRGFLRESLFFLTFAITVTSSVKLAGVLVIFALLISPALIAMILFKKGRLVVYAWIIGFVINVIAILISYLADYPTGYTLVFFHAITALLVCLVKSSKGKEAGGGRNLTSS